MMRRSPLSALLSLVLALALLGTGWAHVPPSVSDARLSVFLAAGGALADICADTGESPGHAHEPDCDACRLIGSAALPASTGIARPEGRALPAGPRQAGDLILALHRENPGSPVRAPPLAA